jgi:hypothetical protein
MADPLSLAASDPLAPGGALPEVPLQYRDYPGQPLPADWTPQERYLYQHHLSNLRRGGVRWPDDPNAISTLYSIGEHIDGRYYMLPTIWDNQIIPPEEAVKRAISAGLQNFPSYENQEIGEKRYQQMHELMDRDMYNVKHLGVEE